MHFLHSFQKIPFRDLFVMLKGKTQTKMGKLVRKLWSSLSPSPPFFIGSGDLAPPPLFVLQPLKTTFLCFFSKNNTNVANLIIGC